MRSNLITKVDSPEWLIAIYLNDCMSLALARSRFVANEIVLYFIILMCLVFVVTCTYFPYRRVSIINISHGLLTIPRSSGTSSRLEH